MGFTFLATVFALRVLLYWLNLEFLEINGLQFNVRVASLGGLLIAKFYPPYFALVPFFVLGLISVAYTEAQIK